MTFTESVRSVLTQYATFRGRAPRSEYWWFYLFTILVSIVTGVIDSVIGVDVVSTVVSLALLVPTIAVTVRRLHDSGRSAWWLLAMVLPAVAGVILFFVGLMMAFGSGEGAIVPFVLGGLLVVAGVIVSIVLMCLPSTVGPNRYGPSPLEPASGNPYGSAYLQQPDHGPAAPYGQQPLPPYGQQPSGQPFPTYPSAPPAPGAPETSESPRRTD